MSMTKVEKILFKKTKKQTNKPKNPHLFLVMKLWEREKSPTNCCIKCQWSEKIFFFIKSMVFYWKGSIDGHASRKPKKNNIFLSQKKMTWTPIKSYELHNSQMVPFRLWRVTLALKFAHWLTPDFQI